LRRTVLQRLFPGNTGPVFLLPEAYVSFGASIPDFLVGTGVCAAVAERVRLV